MKPNIRLTLLVTALCLALCSQAQYDSSYNNYSPVSTYLNYKSGIRFDGPVRFRNDSTLKPSVRDTGSICLVNGKMYVWKKIAGLLKWDPLLNTAGTVYSVDVTSSTLSVLGSPITSAGTITMNLPALIGGGTYSYPTVTADPYGRITAISNGATPVLPTRNLTINGVTHDLSADRTWTIPTSLPAGGLTGTVLTKLSSTDGDASWQPITHPSTIYTGDGTISGTRIVGLTAGNALQFQGDENNFINMTYMDADNTSIMLQAATLSGAAPLSYIGVGQSGIQMNAGTGFGTNYYGFDLSYPTGAVFGGNGGGRVIIPDASGYTLGTEGLQVGNKARIGFVSASTGVAETGLTLEKKLSSGTAANGIGYAVDFKVKTTGASTQLSNQLISKWTTATDASRTSQFSITGVNAGTTQDLFTLGGNGAARFNKYGTGANTGTAAYNLAVDASGNIIEVSGGGSGSVTNVATNAATGITGGPITSTGTLAIDTALLTTRAWHQKGIDSLATKLLTINNNADNRLLTANGGTTSIDAESNLLYSGTAFNPGTGYNTQFFSSGKWQLYDGADGASFLIDNSGNPRWTGGNNIIQMNGGGIVHNINSVSTTHAFQKSGANKFIVSDGGTQTIGTDQATKFYAQAAGTSSTTYPIEVTNSTGTAPLWRISESGVMNFGDQLSQLSNSVLSWSQPAVSLYARPNTTQAANLFQFGSINSTHANTIGEVNVLTTYSGMQFNPATGTGGFNAVKIYPTLNQTGTANGVVRGFYYAPTVTSVLGTHYAFESTAGKVKISDLSSAGTLNKIVEAQPDGTLIVTGLRVAKTYYVSPNGLDANDGMTPATAWQTISKVNTYSGIAAGDVILFEGGKTFSGNLICKGGTQGAPIVYGSYGGERATLQSTGGNGNGVNISNISNVTLTDLVIKIVSPTAWEDGIAINNNSATADNRNISIDHCDISGFNGDGISGYCSVVGFKIRNLRITNCDLHDNVRDGLYIYHNSPSTQSFDSCYLAYNRYFNNLGLTTETTIHTGSGAILGSCSNTLMEYCEAYNNGWKNGWTSGGPFGMWCYNSTNVTIQFCESHDNGTGTGTAAKDGGGFDIDGGSSGCTIQYSYSHDNAGPGYAMFEYGSTGPVYSNNTVRYNISVNDARVGGQGALAFWTAETGSTTCQAHNNLVYMNAASIQNGTPSCIQVVTGSLSFTALNVFNNVFVGDGTGVNMLNGTIQGTWSNNDYYTLNSANANYSTGGITTDPQLLVLPGAAGQTVGAVANRGPNGFLTGLRCKSTSPLINAGLGTLAGYTFPTRDFYGMNTPVGTINIGPYEFR